MTFSENSDVREFSTFDDTNIVKEVTVSQARLKANRLIMKALKNEYAIKVANGTLTTDESFDLKVGEVEIATAILCKSYALRYTMYKYNRSISTGQIGGESDRDSVKNIDFLDKMYPAFWEEGWSYISDYVTNIPGVVLDPYSTFMFDIVVNENLDGPAEVTDADATESDYLSGADYIEWG